MNFKDLTPEQRSEIARKAAESRKAHQQAQDAKWLQPPCLVLRLVRDGKAPSGRTRIIAPTQAVDILARFIQDEPQEHFVVLLLSTRLDVIGVNTVYVGNINETIIRVAEVFRPAILANATSIIIAHNHPSGDPTPSPEDVAVTKEIIKAGEILDIEVLDHIVIGYQSFVSLKDRGLI